MKPFLTILLILNCGILKGQSANNCNIIEGLLKNKEVQEKFYLREDKDRPIIFIDSRKYFKGCRIGQYFGKEVQILQDSNLVKERYYYGIVISHLEKGHERLKIYLFQKSTNSSGYVEFSTKGNKLNVAKFRIGNF